MSESLTPPSSLRYRVAGPADVPRLLDLWTQHSGWGAITMTQWRSWYEEAPYGPAIVSVAEDEDGQVVGMNVMLPSRVCVDGHVVKAVRPSAPILHPSLRVGGASAARSPALALYLAGLATAAATGHAVTYMLPDSGWVPFISRAARALAGLPRHRITTGCLSLELATADGSSHPDRLLTEVSTTFDDELAGLWRAAVRQFPIRCAVERSPEWLAYKHRGDLRLKVRGPGGALAGFLAIGTRRAALTNAFSATPGDLPDVLRSAVAWLRRASHGAHPAVPAALTALDHGACGEACRAAGFREIDYRFGFMADTLDQDAVPLEALAPSAWYLASGD
ncbi:hypothetical protein TBR22_A06640 [Luteitalea sp. TBR-22]|uniref:hypothetical protein n=1 Tax=Luteitalea sp. TBR-22 TaxID=2802971 RepID=UPI001AFB50AA|nr:hypothetical protein [Luteitalea sp. TBR-22]BCS31463.1 hypothetical protein TBR22_A06640 [Luteitalea sp. TBR-22]